MNRNIKLKILKISLMIIIVVTVLFTIGMIFLKYNVEGETNLPFNISKIVIVSSSEGIEKDNDENIWALDINQNNDIYIYIKKNNSYGKTEIIDKIKLDNFQIEKESEKGITNIYQPTEEDGEIFKNSESNKVTEIIYTGELEENIKKRQISNQGGKVVFRCANDKLGEYISNDADEVNYNALLNQTGITSEELEQKIIFDITIELVSKKKYKAQIELDLPVGDILNNQNDYVEITDLSNIIFKRIEN